MTITETLDVRTREDWREWLNAHHATEAEIWLVSHKKASGVASLPYADAVKEALCVGWIDGIRKGLDETRTAQRFTPRRDGSSYSQTNKERLARLLTEDRVLESVRETLGPEDDPESYVLPADIVAALRASPEAWDFFQACPAPYQRIRVAYIETGRRSPEAFETRLASLLRACERKRFIGYGIEAFYE